MNSKKRRGVTNVGTASMMIILIGLSYAILAALAISSAHHDYVLAKKLSDHSKDYYNACNEARIMLRDTEDEFEARSDDGTYTFEVEIDDTQELAVEITFTDSASSYEITKWQAQPKEDWEIEDNTMPGLYGADDN